MKLKTDDVIFLMGGIVLVALIIAHVGNDALATVAAFFGGHKAGSILDDKFADRIDSFSQTTPPPEV